MIFLSVCVGGIASDLTIYILIGIDFLINLYFVVSTWQAKRKPTKTSLEKLKKSVQILVLAESLEVIIPLSYLICFSAAYHGPNAEILGNIKNNYWQYQAVEDFSAAVQNLLFLLTFDILSLALSALFLFFCSGINLFHIYLHLMKEYGLIFSIHQAYLLEYLFCTIAVACAFDFTLQFDWILDKEHWSNTSNSSSLI